MLYIHTGILVVVRGTVPVDEPLYVLVPADQLYIASIRNSHNNQPY